jgi:electron transport complex protein RnfC
VGTCFAIADAIFTGKPLIERVVTVTGEAIENPGNMWALIGSPVAHLLAHCKYKQAGQKQPNIIMGGPMMGFSVSSDLVPIIKTTNCLLAPTDNEISGNNEQACIRCSACADACPASLLPQQLFWHSKAKELDKAQEYNLFDCIECGACAYVCPSEIPLVHYYRIAKSEIRVEQEDKQKSDKARDRFEKREARLIADQQARDEKHRLAAESRKQAMASNGNNAKDKIAAALARAKAKKQSVTEVDEKLQEPTAATPAGNVEQEVKAEAADTSSKEASSNQRVQAAIARAKAKKAAAEVAITETKLKDTNDTIKVSDSNFGVKQQDTDAKVASKPPSKAKLNTQAGDTDSPLSADVASQPQESTQADNKRAKITAAVAKAKSKREAQKIANSQNDTSPVTAVKMNNSNTDNSVDLAKTGEQQIDIKKRRIAAAVTKAKAKKSAEKAANNEQDKPL